MSMTQEASVADLSELERWLRNVRGSSERCTKYARWAEAIRRMTEPSRPSSTAQIESRTAHLAVRRLHKTADWCRILATSKHLDLADAIDWALSKIEGGDNAEPRDDERPERVDKMGDGSSACSSHGDGRFSAVCAKFSSDRRGQPSDYTPGVPGVDETGRS